MFYIATSPNEVVNFKGDVNHQLNLIIFRNSVKQLNFTNKHFETIFLTKIYNF